jgi:hypothetical protein
MQVRLSILSLQIKEQRQIFLFFQISVRCPPTHFTFDPRLEQAIYPCSFPRLIQWYLTVVRLLSSIEEDCLNKDFLLMPIFFNLGLVLMKLTIRKTAKYTKNDIGNGISIDRKRPERLISVQILISYWAIIFSIERS